MKKYQNFLVVLSLLISGYAQAQGQFGRGGMGMQRNQMPETNTQEPPKPLTAEEIVDQEMPKITETLNLNPFEEAILRTTLTKYIQKRIELSILKLPAEKTREAMEKIVKEQDEELKLNLPAEKYEAFTQLQKDGFKPQKKKKKKSKD